MSEALVTRKERLYHNVLQRVEGLLRMEKERMGLPIPETKEHVGLAISILESLRLEGGGVKIDTLKEKEKLYNYMEERLGRLKPYETAIGEDKWLPLTAYRETLSLMDTILDKMRLELLGARVDPDKLKESVFKEWTEKVDSEKIK